MENNRSKISILIWVVLGLFVAAWVLSSIVGTEVQGNVALIDINGVISSGAGNVFSPDTISGEDILELLEEAAEDETIEAVVIRINSPGSIGGAMPWEIGRSIKALDKPIIAVVRDTAASGAYWVASSTDRIFVTPFSIIGSIGVSSSYLEYAGLMERYGVRYRQITSGKFKDTGTPFRELTNEEQVMIQHYINQLHSEFVEIVAENRNLNKAQVLQVSDGRVFTGSHAIELNLADEIGGLEEGLRYIRNMTNVKPVIRKLEVKRGFLDRLSNFVSQGHYVAGYGIGSAIVAQAGRIWVSY